MSPIWREWLIVWNNYLLRNIDPLSPYTPEIVLKLNELESERKS